jgi:hypothetical protein
MTIAVCMVLPEAVILGADSRATTPTEKGLSRWDAEQKLFEVGTNSSIGALTWGLGRFEGGGPSYRTLFARLGDKLAQHPPSSMLEAAQRWADLFWPFYQEGVLKVLDPSLMATVDDEDAPPSARIAAAKTLDIREVGFCVAGWCLPERTPEAYLIQFHTKLTAPPTPEQVDKFCWRGATEVIERLFGLDEKLKDAILGSDKWTGSEDELEALIRSATAGFPYPLALREATDLVHTLVLTTIKVLKFKLVPDCGGTPELAVITADRPFRWVRHKALDSAIEE